MNWLRGDEYHLKSDPPGFVINRANTGDTIAYTAVRVGTGNGPEILHVERGIDPNDETARRDAIQRCKEVCK